MLTCSKFDNLNHLTKLTIWKIVSSLELTSEDEFIVETLRMKMFTIFGVSIVLCFIKSN